MRIAGPLVRIGSEIEDEFGIPIINKRVSVTPIALGDRRLIDSIPAPIHSFRN